MILVAGGTGHLGTALIPSLSARGGRVRVLTRDLERAGQRLGEGHEFARGDVRDPRSLAAAMDGVEAVVSAVTGFGPGGIGPRLVDFEGNVNLVRAAEAAGVRRFVLLSMHDARADHPLELARMKCRAEDAVRASRLDWTIVRPTAFMGLWAGIVGDPIVNKGKTTVFGKGDNSINFISERDVAQFVELALFDRGLSRTALDIGGPDNITFNQMVQQIEIASGRKAAVNHVPVAVMRSAALLMRPIKPDIAAMIRAGVAFDTTDMGFDVTELRRRFPQVQLTSLAQVIDLKLDRRANHTRVA
ncbi:MAG: SDR family oxidoreductase [Candidatus Dormibacter sp.]